MIFKPSRPLSGPRVRKRARTPARSIRLARGHRAGGVTPVGARHRPPQSKPVTPASRLVTGRAVGGNRARAENPGRRASSRSNVLPSRAFVCADLKLCSDSSAGAGIGRLVATGRAHLPPSLPAGESSSETATRGDRKSRIGISAHSQLSPSPACRAPPRRSEQSPSPPAARSYQRIKSTSAGNCSSPTGEIEIAHDSSNATGGTRLGQAGDQPLAFAELHAGGIDFPAAVVCELELNGYAIERVYSHGRLVGVCLLEPQPPRHTRRTPAPPAPLVVQIAILRRPHDHRRWSRL